MDNHFSSPQLSSALIIGKKMWALFITADGTFQNNAGQKTLKLKKSEMFVR
jgi:hypothetical protein